MLFVQSLRGLSHTKLEDTKDEHLELAVAGARPPGHEDHRTPVAMPELPSGTVTFLFSDIEGSTSLLRELGDAYAGALAEHRGVFRAAFAEHGGVEVDTQGDAFFAAFARASDAVAAAAEIQSQLAPGPIRVRIGVHTGEPQITDEGYVGLDVHRGARVCAAGHGGQVLLSQTTRDLVDAEASDLGEHRLKDLLEPQRLFQLGTEEFPPLKTLDWTNLPVQTTPLIGRERELTEAGALLREKRLLTVVGPPGAGKTRLALQLAAEAADEFDNVWWVGLQEIRDAELVEPTIAQTVGAKADLASLLARPPSAPAPRQRRAGARLRASARRAPRRVEQPQAARRRAASRYA